tara:strand:+ start:6447 stop:7649 length:1203 start_codon:yes stop_codon:yes gene_type:complete
VSRTVDGQSRVRYKPSNLNQFGEFSLQSSRPSLEHGKYDNPVQKILADSVAMNLIPKTNNDNYMCTMGFKYRDGECFIVYGRKGTQHHIDGKRIPKKDLAVTLAKIIMRGAFVRNVDTMDDYIEKVIHFPPNVLHAIENRSPYHFYSEGTRQEVLINTKLISNDECALEISEGVWGAITLKDLNVFLNTFRHNQSKSKVWYRATPAKLWRLLMGQPPTDVQNKLCVAWLMQNRKQDMVEDRATQLLHEMDAEYPQIRLVQFRNPLNKALFVRGKVADWVVVDEKRGMKQGHQNVNTYMIGKMVEGQANKSGSWKGHALSGSICIDNIHRNSSIGDQLTARALALMNDVSSAKQIYTIRTHVDSAVKRGEDPEYRLDMSKLKSWTREKENLYIARKREASK